MSRQPTVGGDAGGWGAILNDYLSQGIGSDGTLKAFQVINVKDSTYGAKGDGVTDDTSAIQAAINAASGGIVFFPAGRYSFSALTISNPMTLRGQGWSHRANAAFGDATWSQTALMAGSILISTATSGTAMTITHSTNVFPYHLRDLAIIGPGSGTSTGIALGSSTAATVQNVWSNVLVANFSKAVNLTNCQDSTFIGLRMRGNTTGLELNTATNQNVYVNLESQFATHGVKGVTCNLNYFYGGLLQNNTNGLTVAPSGVGAMESLHFDGMWFESNTSNINFDLTSGGSLTNGSFNRCRMSSGTPLAYVGAGTLNFLTYWNNQWSGLAVTLSASHINALFIANNTGTVTDNGTKTLISDNSTGSKWHVGVIATASLPSGNANLDGTVLIEDGGAGTKNLIIYGGGQRFRISGGTAF